MSNAEQRATDLLKSVGPKWDAFHIEQAVGGLERKQRMRRRRRVIVAATALLGVAMVAIGLARPAATGELAQSPPGQLRLKDGSTLSLNPEARVEVREESPRLVRVSVEGGQVDLDITPRPDRQFVVEVAGVKVVVLGTQFDVTPLEGRAQVRVRRGHVRVLWDGATRDLYAGDDGIFPEPIPTSATPPASLVEPTPPTAAKPVRDWRQLSRRGAYVEAYELIARGGKRAVRDGVDDLLLAADAARLSGHPMEALPFLEQILDSHAKDNRAAVAAFTRGRILLGLGRVPEAGPVFEQALTLGAEGALEENALGRAVEAYGRAGDLANAQRLARVYLAKFPRGQWAAAVRAHAELSE
jgi:transmembrane sensor